METIWKAAAGVLSTVAPMLATAVGGPLAGAATNAIIGALGLPQEDYMRAVTGNDDGLFVTCKALFPCGSITGAPKIRAMQIIEELERGPRGVYSGAVGYFGFNGAADFGMTIRSIVFEGSKAYIGVGGGITSDSDPMAELEETKLKAQALLRVLNAPDPWA